VRVFKIGLGEINFMNKHILKKEDNIQNNDPFNWMTKSIEFELEEEIFGIEIFIGIIPPYHKSNNKIKMKYKKRFSEDYQIIEFNKKLFKNIYKKLFEININELFLKSAIMIALGERNDLTITLSLGDQHLKYKICSYEYNINKRGLVEINKIIKKILKMCNYNGEELLYEMQNGT